MTTPDQVADDSITEGDPIESLFGRATADYVSRKNRGGRNAARGLDFETVFAICKFGELIDGILSRTDDVRLTKQAREFVDDLQISFPASRRKEDYQLKDALDVSWTARKGQIRNDFANQQRLNRCHHDCGSTQYLIVSNDKIASRLRRLMPTKIACHTQVELFPRSEASPNALLLTPGRLRAAVAEVSCSPDAVDKLEAVFGALFAAWSSVPASRSIPLAEVLDNARRINAFVRATAEVPPLPTDVDGILRGIVGFSFEISRGFFCWRFGETDSGILSYSCLDSKFEVFLRLLRRARPTCFEDLELLLLC